MVRLQAHSPAGPGHSRWVSLKAGVTMRHFRAARIRSWLRISLLHGRCHLRRDARCARRRVAAFVGSRPTTASHETSSHGSAPADRRERGRVMAVDDQARYFLAFPQGTSASCEKAPLAAPPPGTCARPSAPHRRPGGHACQDVAGARRRCLGHHLLQVAEQPAVATDGMAVAARGCAFHGYCSRSGGFAQGGDLVENTGVEPEPEPEPKPQAARGGSLQCCPSGRQPRARATGGPS